MNITLDMVNMCNRENNPPFIKQQSGTWVMSKTQEVGTVACAKLKSNPNVMASMTLQKTYVDLKKTFDDASNNLLKNSKVELVKANGSPAPTTKAQTPKK